MLNALSRRYFHLFHSIHGMETFKNVYVRMQFYRDVLAHDDTTRHKVYEYKVNNVR